MNEIEDTGDPVSDLARTLRSLSSTENKEKDISSLGLQASIRVASSLVRALALLPELRKANQTSNPIAKAQGVELLQVIQSTLALPLDPAALHPHIDVIVDESIAWFRADGLSAGKIAAGSALVQLLKIDALAPPKNAFRAAEVLFDYIIVPKSKQTVKRVAYEALGLISQKVDLGAISVAWGEPLSDKLCVACANALRANTTNDAKKVQLETLTGALACARSLYASSSTEFKTAAFFAAYHVIKSAHAAALKKYIVVEEALSLLGSTNFAPILLADPDLRSVLDDRPPLALRVVHYLQECAASSHERVKKAALANLAPALASVSRALEDVAMPGAPYGAAARKNCKRIVEAIVDRSFKASTVAAMGTIGATARVVRLYCSNAPLERALEATMRSSDRLAMEEQDDPRQATRSCELSLATAAALVKEMESIVDDVIVPWAIRRVMYLCVFRPPLSRASVSATIAIVEAFAKAGFADRALDAAMPHIINRASEQVDDAISLAAYSRLFRGLIRVDVIAHRRFVALLEPKGTLVAVARAAWESFPPKSLAPFAQPAIARLCGSPTPPKEAFEIAELLVRAVRLSGDDAASLEDFIERTDRDATTFEMHTLIASTRCLLQCPIRCEMLDALVRAMCRGLKLGSSDDALLEQCLDAAERWASSPNIVAAAYPAYLPLLSQYLSSPAHALRVATLLGRIGSEKSRCAALSLSSAGTSTFAVSVTLPLGPDRIQVPISSNIFSRISFLAKTSTDRETRVRAIELAHALVICMVGRRSDVHADAFDVVFALGADDVEVVARNLFSPLALQLARWYGRPQNEQSAEVFLNAAFRALASSTQGAALRALGASAIKELFIYSIRSQTKKSVAAKTSQNSPIARIVRRMLALARHPNRLHRVGAATLFDGIYRDLREEESLAEFYAIPILRAALLGYKLECNGPLRAMSDRACRIVARFHFRLDEFGDMLEWLLDEAASSSSSSSNVDYCNQCWDILVRFLDKEDLDVGKWVGQRKERLMEDALVVGKMLRLRCTELDPDLVASSVVVKRHLEEPTLPEFIAACASSESVPLSNAASKMATKFCENNLEPASMKLFLKSGVSFAPSFKASAAAKLVQLNLYDLAVNLGWPIDDLFAALVHDTSRIDDNALSVLSSHPDVIKSAPLIILERLCSAGRPSFVSQAKQDPNALIFRFYPGCKIVKLHAALRGIILADDSAALSFLPKFKSLLQDKELPIDCKMELLVMMPLFASTGDFKDIVAMAESRIVVQYSPLGKSKEATLHARQTDDFAKLITHYFRAIKESKSIDMLKGAYRFLREGDEHVHAATMKLALVEFYGSDSDNADIAVEIITKLGTSSDATLSRTLVDWILAPLIKKLTPSRRVQALALAAKVLKPPQQHLGVYSLLYDGMAPSDVKLASRECFGDTDEGEKKLSRMLVKVGKRLDTFDAYDCVSSVVCATQTKPNLFKNLIFVPRRVSLLAGAKSLGPFVRALRTISQKGIQDTGLEDCIVEVARAFDATKAFIAFRIVTSSPSAFYPFRKTLLEPILSLATPDGALDACKLVIEWASLGPLDLRQGDFDAVKRIVNLLIPRCGHRKLSEMRENLKTLEKVLRACGSRCAQMRVEWKSAVDAIVGPKSSDSSANVADAQPLPIERYPFRRGAYSEAKQSRANFEKNAILAGINVVGCLLSHDMLPADFEPVISALLDRFTDRRQRVSASAASCVFGILELLWKRSDEEQFWQLRGRVSERLFAIRDACNDAVWVTLLSRGCHGHKVPRSLSSCY